MAFEAAVDLDTKEEALKLLVDKGILTQTDFEKCKKALSKKAAEAGLIYHDKTISVFYKSTQEQQMLGGKGIKVYLIVENKTKEPITIKATCAANGIIMEHDIQLVSNLLGKAKAIVEVVYFFNKLSVIDIHSIKDLKTVSFCFSAYDKMRREICSSTIMKEVVVNP